MEKQLPENWASISLKDVVRSTKGKKPIRLEEFNFDGSLPYMDIKALELNIIKQYADIKSSKLFSKGDVAIVWDGARSGWVSKANAGAIGSTICALTPIKINEDYLYYYLLDQYPFINSKARGVGIPHVDPILLWSLEFPLPPLAEQERIAEKLDALFGQLDSVRGAMSRIPTLLANLRQQILTHAVTGKLTQEWRQGKNLAEWEEKSLSDIAIPKSGYPFNASDFTDYGIQVIRMGNLYNNKLSLDRNPVFLPNDYDENVIKKSAVKKNDILLTLTGTKYKRDYGYAIKIEIDDTVLLLNQRILSLTSLINPNFLLIALRGDQFRDQFFGFETGGVNQGNVGVKNVMTIALDIPPVEEQTEIANRVQSLFEKLDSIEQRYQMLKTKLENLPQAILHKAFKGELVEQLPSDGNATDILREIEQLKKSLKKK